MDWYGQLSTWLRIDRGTDGFGSLGHGIIHQVVLACLHTDQAASDCSCPPPALVGTITLSLEFSSHYRNRSQTLIKITDNFGFQRTAEFPTGIAPASPTSLTALAAPSSTFVVPLYHLSACICNGHDSRPIPRSTVWRFSSSATGRARIAADTRASQRAKCFMMSVVVFCTSRGVRE